MKQCTEKGVKEIAVQCSPNTAKKGNSCVAVCSNGKAEGETWTESIAGGLKDFSCSKTKILEVDLNVIKDSLKPIKSV